MSYIFVLLVVSTVIGPTNLYSNVGQNAYFLWNTTGNHILATTWGLHSQRVKLVLITVNFITHYSSASRYKGRVEYIGNLSLGHAWFILKNLNVDDTNEYVAQILEGGTSRSYRSTVNLRVSGTCINLIEITVFNSWIQ